jgi:hypothetical protein
MLEKESIRTLFCTEEVMGCEYGESVSSNLMDGIDMVSCMPCVSVLVAWSEDALNTSEEWIVFIDLVETFRFLCNLSTSFDKTPSCFSYCSRSLFMRSMCTHKSAYYWSIA